MSISDKLLYIRLMALYMSSGTDIANELHANEARNCVTDDQRKFVRAFIEDMICELHEVKEENALVFISLCASVLQKGMDEAHQESSVEVMLHYAYYASIPIPVMLKLLEELRTVTTQF